MLKRIAVVLTAATVLGVAPASAQVVYGGGWWAALTATTATIRSAANITMPTIRGAIFTGDTFTSGAAGGPATDYVS
jgi:hypothetical protein